MIPNRSGCRPQFASAKSEGFLDIALECAHSSGVDPNTLLRACRDFAQKDIGFALQIGVQAIIIMMTGSFYEEVTATEIAIAYQDVEKIARENGRREEFRAQLGREVVKRASLCKEDLREVVLKKLEVVG